MPSIQSESSSGVSGSCSESLPLTFKRQSSDAPSVVRDLTISHSEVLEAADNLRDTRGRHLNALDALQEAQARCRAWSHHFFHVMEREQMDGP